MTITDSNFSATALVDTGAARTLIRQDVALSALRKCGRPCFFQKCEDHIVSMTGNKVNILGKIELDVYNVGLVEFLVVDKMVHEIIIGFNTLLQYGFKLDDKTLVWGTNEFKVGSQLQFGLDSSIISEIDCGLDNVKQVVNEYQDLFREGVLPVANLPAIEIRSEPGKVVHKRPYRTPLAKRLVVEQEVEKMLQLGVIRPSQSEWASPITLVPKPDGSVRFCVDYRALNDITIKDRYPLPLVQDIFDTLKGSTIFSTLDLASGYWQLPVEEGSIHKTAFVCHCGTYEWLRMPFGLTCAPAVFQRAMNQILSKFIGKFVMVFLDDVIVFSKSPEEHAEHLKQIFDAFREAGLTLKEKKCHFAKSALNLLGYVVSNEGISAQPEKTEAISNLLSPNDVSEIRSFLGMCGYYRQLVPHFAQIAEPLHQLTRKGVVWRWADKQEESFQSLKRALVTSPIMAYPDTSKSYILYTDACDYAVGAILCQEDDEGIERPIQYVSHQLTSTQRKWATIEKEAFGVVYAIKKLRAYLLGSDFVIFTDHKPLLSFFSGEIANTKIQRWAILLAEFGAPIKYRPGPNNVRADMLSRIKARHSEASVIDVDSEWVTPDQVKEHLPPLVPVQADNLCMDTILMGQIAEFSEERVSAREEDSRYCMIDNILYSIARPKYNAPNYPRLVLPSMFRNQVIERCHSDVGHQSLFKTMSRVQETYVWSGMKRDVKDWISKCGLCQVHTKRRERVSMGEMPIAHAPGQFVGIDLIGPLLPSRYSGARYIMTCIDHYDGWAEAYPLVRKTNEAVWERLRNEYIPRFSVPEVILTDQGSEFKGQEFKQWLEGMGIEHRRTSPYHPQSNGRTERFNGTLKRILRKLVNGNRADWEDQLGAALTAYRISTSTVTGQSPFMLRYVHPPRYPLTRLLSEDSSRSFENRLELQADLMQHAATATRDSRHYNRQRLARQANAEVIKPGDKVIVRAREPLTLTAQWDYGFIVTKVNGKVLNILHPTTGVKQIINRDQVRLVDPDIAWDSVHPRPRRVQTNQARVKSGRRANPAPDCGPANGDGNPFDNVPTNNPLDDDNQSRHSDQSTSYRSRQPGGSREADNQIPSTSHVQMETDESRPVPKLRMKRYLSGDGDGGDAHRRKRSRWELASIRRRWHF